MFDQTSFIKHLAELRKRIILSLAAVLFAAVLSYFYADPVLDFLLRPIQSQIGSLYFFSPADAFIIRIKISLLAGLILASPVIASQIWLFVSPGLYKNEKKWVAPLVLVTSLLFIAGTFFSFFLVLPVALGFLMGFQTEFLKPMISITQYVHLLVTLVLAFGIAFNLPVFLLALVFLGVTDAKRLGQYRKHAIVLIFIAAALLTPGPDVVSQIALALPLIVLFEVSLIVAKVIDLRRGMRKDYVGPLRF